MKFPWNKYTELTLNRRNTLQIFITNRCNLKCDGCFARNVMGDSNKDISIYEYLKALDTFRAKGGKQVNLLGGEPLLHPHLRTLLEYNRTFGLKTTVYTNGRAFEGYSPEDFKDIKLRVSIYSYGSYGDSKKDKSFLNLPEKDGKRFNFDANFMVSSETKVEDLFWTANIAENNYNCKVFFISSLRELDNERKEFFDDTPLTMPVIEYKELVYRFLYLYRGDMDIHVSTRGVFESTTTLPCRKCRFANYIIGGKIIQCPYDVVNEKYQDDYNFNVRDCQHHGTCLMSKVIYRKR